MLRVAEFDSGPRKDQPKSFVIPTARAERGGRNPLSACATGAYPF